ncbi:MAG: hypothetical protein LQ340_001913 [Diploschistes diacapsis]|nr:MAG: hypothetical protein LQ340_001913 [Diploschistes diacapsis]
MGGKLDLGFLISLPFGNIKHKVDTLDAQPSGTNGEILVIVTGALLVDEEQKPMSYVQVFNLQRDETNYYVYNDIFKLVYPASG